ncbi:MAG TPA: hypothetical protein P5123_13845 [Spirochaetota bacterium]|nr:hypothetical protein [Spirochaetota bacterium]
MNDKINKNIDDKKSKLEDCVKPNNAEAQRNSDQDEPCHEAVDGK